MMKVEKCVSEVVEWMNNAVSAQAKKSLDQDPAVHSSEIKAKLQVSTIKLILEGFSSVTGRHEVILGGKK